MALGDMMGLMKQAAQLQTKMQEMQAELDRIAAQEGVSRSNVLRASLEDYFFVRRFRALRQRMMAAAQAQGIFTDEDVFDRVS